MTSKTEAAVTPEALKPPLKWAGGKRWLVPRLAPLYQRFRDYRLVEPFCGGLAVALGLNPARALLNDINPHAVNFYQQLQSGLTLQLEMRNEGELYYAHRETFNQLIAEPPGVHSREAAALFYYLNRTGYNGLCRFNSKGRFNVPFGRHASLHYRRDFTDYASVLSRWEFSVADFADVVTGANDFIYADPPYDVEFHTYSKGGFDWANHERLAAWLAGRPGPVVISNQATKRVEALYREHGFSIEYLHGPRNISRTGDRTPALEVLATLNID